MNAITPGSPSRHGDFPLEISSTRVSHGTPARWTEEKGWLDRDGVAIPDTMLLVYYFQGFRRWVNKRATYNVDDLPSDSKLDEPFSPACGMANRIKRRARKAVEVRL